MKNIKPFSVQGHLSEAVSAPSMEGREAINRANEIIRSPAKFLLFNLKMEGINI